MAEPTRILIVEDEAIIAMDLQETLVEAGYAVIATVASGEEALAICAQEIPDLVLMDVHLQGRLTGIDTAQQLRESYGIPSVLLTAHYDPATLAASQQAGVFAYLIKPYDQRELCATLATALTRARNEGELQRQLQELRSAPAAASAGAIPELLKICTLCAPPTLEFQGRTVRGDLFPRTQREMLALLLSSPHLRVDREVLEAELWPESPAKQARSSFDATLGRLRRLFNTETGSSAGMDLFSLKNGVVAIENCSVDLHRFKALDEEGSALRRHGDEEAAIGAFVKAVALWQGEFLAGLSSHHNVLTLRQYNTQRVFDLSLWLGEAFAQRQRREEELAALRLALRAIPTSEKTAGTLYILLLALERVEEGGALLKDFSRGLSRDGLPRQQVQMIMRRIEQRANFERCQRRTP
ncbi:MAG: response regulator [Desulfuromonadales bacterium]|nr:response regulator [Desulfuromonadales bacterium]